MTAIGLRTSKVLFERMTHAILRAPLKWVDTNPSGRILNRFTSDMFMVDRRLPGDLGNFLQSIFQLIVTIAASLSVSIYVILAGIVLMFVYARVASIYIHVAREVKRLNSISHSPIFDQVSDFLVNFLFFTFQAGRHECLRGKDDLSLWSMSQGCFLLLLKAIADVYPEVRLCLVGSGHDPGVSQDQLLHGADVQSDRQFQQSKLGPKS